VLIWLNGAFGAGKTSVARALAARTANGAIVDPEHIGALVGAFHGGDFQDLRAWRRWTVRVVRAVARVRTVIAPMTLVEPSYFEEIIGTLRRSIDVRHFTLVVPRDVLRARLRARRRGDWAEKQIDRCVDSLEDERFARHVVTEGRGIDAIADDIARAIKP
jgi:predicted ABC-type ATPase